MAKTYRCGRCGFPIDRGTALKSQQTKTLYCPHIDECGRRANNDLTFSEMNTLARLGVEELGWK